MLPSKNISKMGSSGNRSFGGHNKPKSGSQTRDPAAWVRSGQPSELTSLTSDSAKLSLHGEEFPALGEADTRSSSAASNSANPDFASLCSGAFSRVQVKDMASPSWKPSTPSKASTSSRQIHHGAPQEDEWADEEDHLQHKRNFKNKRRGPIRRRANDVAEDGKGTPTSQDRLYFLSRLLSKILRHTASDLKLQILNDGYVAVNDLLKLDIQTVRRIPLRAHTVEEILTVVEQDSKQRFTLLTENGILLIRANQGHSIKTIESDKLLEPILSADDIPVCVHGTYMRNLDLIVKSGLKKMGRNHVHFASGLPRVDGVISGMRDDCQVLIYLDAKKALQGGMKLYMSANGVILTEGFNGVVPPEYFERIARWDKGKIIPYP